jgi:hypothetical protein
VHSQSQLNEIQKRGSSPAASAPDGVASSTGTSSGALLQGKDFRMNSCYREPGLNALLSDPVIRAVMAADRVDPRKLEAELSNLGSQLRERSERRRTHSCC